MKFTFTLRGMIYAAMLAALTAIGANLTIPLPLVPLTLQTFFVFLAGALLGATHGGLSLIIYVLLGLIGLPVFSRGQSGLGVLLGPTGGYLFGFIVAAFLIGILIDFKKNSGVIWMILAMSIGLLVIYACGVTQLYYTTQRTFAEAITVGALRPLPGDIIKIFAAAIIAGKVRDKIKR
ncbi:MAG: biotin transporter BioY [Desulfobacteraceae bacterium]|nr:MAG: biotin transporter BioY [Desulfobacteraceae bacterium]